ncbi:hypothetical protein G6F37_012060 [Rhizopus arrhizus]|nr:hypothetical protein G6F38_011715 [Rhizopus arrhizus]KAG1145921.1 hypothetical protein G6F37_012060 [Rhizopus arrhizus]
MSESVYTLTFTMITLPYFFSFPRTTPRRKHDSIIEEEQPAQRRRRTLVSDAQWCVDNKEQPTCKRFIEHHGLLEKAKAIQRYRNIIKTYLPDSSSRLKSELETWKQTADWSEFWMQKRRQLAKLATHKTCLDYATNVHHFQKLKSHFDDSINTPTSSKHNFEQLEYHPPNNISSIPWMVAGVDLANIFSRYKQSAKERSEDQTLNIGSSLHDILSLTGILLLCPNQHSDQLIDHFGQTTLDKITEALLSNILDKDLDWENAEYVKLSRIVNNMVKEIKAIDLDKRSKAIDVAELELQQLANDLNPFKKAIVKGIINMISKLPAYVLKDERCIGESELTCSYFDPILSRLLANPASGVHLRWSDITVAETPRQRPDAVISKMRQLSFGPSLCFGEAKVQSTSNYDLCHDLLRLALFSKESIDIDLKRLKSPESHKSKI